MTHPIDLEMGQRIRDLRQQRGLTQTEVAEPCGITFQQIQKYETGANRISVSRLCEIARVLGAKPENLVRGLR